MAIRAERSIDDPIVVFVFEDKLDSQTITEFKAVSTALLSEMGIYYSILDIRNIDVTAQELAALLKTVESDSRIEDIVVVGQVKEKTSESELQIMHFEADNAAIDYIRKRIARRGFT